MFDQQVINSIRAHALECFPRESCGLVAGDVYLPCENTADDPCEDFRIAPEELARAERSGTVRAVVHSHPDQPDCPSEADMAGQIASGLAWGIITLRSTSTGVLDREPFFWGGDAPVAPIKGRRFRHGVHDCYAVVRDWYLLERGIALPDFPRPDAWWERPGRSLVMENLDAAGFEVVGGSDLLTPEVGDVAVMQVDSKVPNHTAVYVGRGVIIHHLANRLSREDVAMRWRKAIIHWTRRKEGAAC